MQVAPPATHDLAAGRLWSPRRLVAAGLAALVLGAGIGVGLHLATSSSSSATARPVLEGQAVWPAGRIAAPDFALRDQRGQLVSLAAQRGRTVVLAFMDSRCHQITSLPKASHPVFLVVSVNPWADTRASARAAASRWGFTGAYHWLLGSTVQLAKVWHAYRIYVKQTSGDIVHSDAIYVIDRHGYERAGFLFPFLPGPVERDLKALAREGV
jgi:cytochrome oxidase Cu insertion factor (SCO1/SenC/PrrC family)